MHEEVSFPCHGNVYHPAFAVRLEKRFIYFIPYMCSGILQCGYDVLFIYDVNNLTLKQLIPIAISIGLLLTVAYMVYVTAKTYFAPANEGQEIKAVSEQLEKKEKKRHVLQSRVLSKNREYLQK